MLTDTDVLVSLQLAFDRNAASKLSLLVTALVNKENLWMATRIVPMSDRPSVYMRPGNQTSLDEVFIIVTEAAAVANLKV